MICTSCGQDNPVGFGFCGSCGAALAADPVAEVRKTVTVVFCDLVGSTSLGERTDPELLRGLMTRYHAELRRILEYHGGTVEKFVGDAAMAVFGLPQAHEDDALRAVRAAVEMRDAVGALGLTVRIGVNTGEVVAGAGETLVTGDAVNVAARLEQAAGAGDVLLGTATERLVRDRIHAEAVSLELKGKSEPVQAFHLLELHDDVPAFTRPIAAPFVGRADELALLERTVSTAVETRVAQLVTIVGPPGIGKSRLVRELLAHVQARVVVGRCLSYGEGITYWPLQEIVEQVGDARAALDGTADAELAATRIAAAVAPTGAPSSPEEIAWGFRRLFEALAAREPLVVVLDDIHWAEPVLLDLVEYVAAFAGAVPLVVVCTARPDLLESRPDWAAPRQNTVLHTLEPLSEADSESFVTLLGDVSPERRVRIVEAAEGNPLFVEQLVAMQIETGDAALEVPPSLQALLAARIGRLAEPERAVVERCAVEGRLFHRGAVAALLSEADRAGVGGHLLTLVRKQLIRPDRAVVPGDDGFRFGHALIRDAAYEAIPKRQRAALHERYADWLVATIAGEAPDEIVGYHLEQAYRYGAELGSVDAPLGERAAERLEASAQAARLRGDAVAAANLFGRAAELVPDGPARPSLLAALGGAVHEAGDLERAKTVLEEAVLLARQNRDEHAEWLGRLALEWLASETEPEGGADRLLREGEAAIAARSGSGDHDVLARAWRLVAEACNWRGQWDGYADALHRAAEHARLAGDVALEIGYVRQKAPYFIFGPGSVDDALAWTTAVLEPLGDVAGVQDYALHVRGHMLARRGESERAFEAVETFRKRLRELGRETEYLWTAGCVWDVARWTGVWEQGEAALLDARATAERVGNSIVRSGLELDLGEAAFLLGRLDEAERLIELGRELSATDDAANILKWATVAAQLRAEQGDLAASEEIARDAVARADPGEFLEIAAETRLVLADVLRRKGDDLTARAAAAEAVELFERKGNVVGAGRARAALDVLSRAPDG